MKSSSATQIIQPFFLTGGLLILFASLATAQKLSNVVQDGKTDWAILVAKPDDVNTPFDINKSTGWDYEKSGYEMAAAHELSQVLCQVTGANLPVAIVENIGEVAKYSHYFAIGKLAQELGAVAPKSRFGIDGSTVQIEVNRILLIGETPIASYFAVIRLLEMAGCRWFMPGARGEITPRRSTTLSFPIARLEEVPRIWSRYLWYSGGAQALRPEARQEFHRWLLHNRQYGMRVDGGHVWTRILPAKEYFATHPEWYAQVKGQRKPGMLCTSNDEMTREFIKNYREYILKNPQTTWFSLSQNDGINFCECSQCIALDPGLRDPIMPNLPQITDRIVHFNNKVVSE